MGLLFTNGILFCQGQMVSFWEPQVSLNYKVTSTYSHNFSIVNRNYVYETNKLQLRTRHFELAHFSTLKTRDNQSWSLGIMYRFRNIFEEERNNELRLTQQYNITHRAYRIRFGHRFRSEQRLGNEYLIQRFRYRFAMDLPLEGDKLDIGESFLVGSTESVLSMSSSDRPSYDQRISLAVGWLLKDRVTFQTGIEYRIEDYTQESNNLFFLNSSLVFSL
ncbi:MAG: hypothetical protein ACI9AV_002052 [Sediminicola sp.]|jgi:hypothetical protein